jgi:hypothetical protein
MVTPISMSVVTNPPGPHSPLSPMMTSASTMSVGSPAIMGNYFGSDLVQIMESDAEKSPIPRIVSNCVEYIEASGLMQEGLYRMSGSSAQVMKLKSILDKGLFSLIQIQTFHWKTSYKMCIVSQELSNCSSESYRTHYSPNLATRT